MTSEVNFARSVCASSTCAGKVDVLFRNSLAREALEKFSFKRTWAWDGALNPREDLKLSGYVHINFEERELAPAITYQVKRVRQQSNPSKRRLVMAIDLALIASGYRKSAFYHSLRQLALLRR